MSHVGTTGVDGTMLRVLSVAVPLRADVPPSAVAMMRDPGARLVGRLGCVVNNAAQFAHAVAVYRLRSLVVTLQRAGDGDAEEGSTVFPLAVSLLVGGARPGAMTVAVIGDLDSCMALVAQRTHPYWCWQLGGLLELAWGPPAENHHAPVPPCVGVDALAQALAQRSRVPHCGALPWRRVGDCYIQGGEVSPARPDDSRGIILRGGCRVEFRDALLGLARLVNAQRVLVVVPSPVLRQWWTAALPAETFECRLAHDMLYSHNLSQHWPVVVWDAVQPFPLDCTVVRPRVDFSVVLAKAQDGVGTTRAEHTLCRLLGISQAQVQGFLAPPASFVMHRAEPAGRVGAVHACEVGLPDDLRAIVQQLARPDVHGAAVVDNTPFVAASPRLQGRMFGTLLSSQDAQPGDARLSCPMCEIEDACGDWPLVRLVGCAHAVCLKHLQLWPHQCSVCRAPIDHTLQQMPVIRRTGLKTRVAPGGGTVVMPATVRRDLQDAVARYWGALEGALTPKLGRCVDDAENLYRAGGAVVVVAAHDAAVVHVADTLGRQRGVPVKIWLGVSDVVPVPRGGAVGGGRFVLCLAQRMVCCAARLAWMMPAAASCVPHAVCASSTVPVLSLVRMLGGCRGGGTVTYVVYRDTPEARDLEHRVAEFRHLCPEMAGSVQVYGGGVGVV